MREKTYYIKTFGCQMNLRDSEIMAQKLEEDGFSASSVMEDASLIIINTCSVRAKAAQKVFSLLGSLRKLKQENQNLKICVAGCVAQQDGQEVLARMPHVDLVLGTQHIYEIADLLRCKKSMSSALELSDSYEIPRYIPRLMSVEETSIKSVAGSAFSRFVTIMQGCNNFCTYCVVPYTRGREVSRKAKDIIDEIGILVNGGGREITLLGQNVNSYGRSNPVYDDGLPYSFARLLREVAAIDGLQRLRFTTSHPKDLSDELIACFADIKILSPQFHLPVQSGSDTVLKRMNRKYSVDEYLEKVDRLLEIRPNIALTTDIIVGFPGERDADFRATMDLLERVRYHGSFSFKYSDRPGTAAERFDQKCEESVKRDRLRVFQRRQDEISAERNREYVGQQRNVLIENVNNLEASGRMSTNHIVHLESWPGSLKAGDLVPVKITRAGKHSLKGCLVDIWQE